MEDDDSGANIVRFTGKSKEPIEERMLHEVPYTACQHQFAPFEVDVKAGRCKCLRCGGEVSPIFVLEQLMHQESRWMRTRQAYMIEMQRLAERRRTKCDHCGCMTRISQR